MFGLFLYFIKIILPALALGGTGLWLFAHPFQFLAVQVAGLVHTGGFAFDTGCFFLEEIGIVAFVHIHVTVAVQFPDLVTNIVEEIAVVGHQ